MAGGQPPLAEEESMLASTRMRGLVRAAPELPCWSDPDLFFAEGPRDIEQAKALCRSCPLRAACLTGALERGEPWGVWGGELLQHGMIIAQKRARGRPRKVASADRSAA
jgi:WhiB family redox-sensing transcriptional regulator